MTFERVNLGEDVTLYRGDCLEVMPTLEAGSVDAVVTDPPYGIGYKSSWKTGMNGLERINDNSFGEDIYNPAFIPEIYRLLHDNTLVYCFTRWDVLGIWLDDFRANNFDICGRLIWNKSHWKMGDLRYYGSQIEDVILAKKGNPIIFDGGIGRRGNLFTSSSSSYMPEGQVNHPTQKPEQVIRIWIEDSTDNNEIVLDPFMGSGTTGVAAVQLGRKFIGVEIDQGYFDIAVKRIKQAQLQMRLPI